MPEDVEKTDPRFGFLELYADGRAFAAKPIIFDTADDARAGEVGEMTLVDDPIIALDAALSWCVDRAGAWGGADVEAGLMDGGELELPYTTPLTLHSADGGELRRLNNTRKVRRPLRSLVTVDLASCTTQVGRLAAAHDVATALLQHFGIDDADMIDPDGTMIGWRWGGRHRHEVQRWAQQRDLPYRDHP